MLLKTIPRLIDPINEWVAGVAKWLMLILALLNMYEVTMRYLFNSPSIWVYDLSYMLGGAFFTLGMGYTMLKGIHVRVDVIYVKLSRKVQAWLDAILTLFVFFPLFGMLVYKLVPWVLRSWARHEKATGSFWMPPIYPLKTVLLVAVILLILQAISELCKDLDIMIHGDSEVVK